MKKQDKINEIKLMKTVLWILQGTIKQLLKALTVNFEEYPNTVNFEEYSNQRLVQ